jgi:hypothetical protein
MQTGGHWMRRNQSPTKKEPEAGEYTFYFQIANGGGRKACSVRVQAPSHHDATNFFRENWPRIELRAREKPVASDEGGEINLK